MGGGGENFLQPLLSYTYPLVVEGNWCVDSTLTSLLRGSAVNFFSRRTFFSYVTVMNIAKSGSCICFDFSKLAQVHEAYTKWYQIKFRKFCPQSLMDYEIVQG